MTVFAYSGRVKSPEWRWQRRRASLRHFEIFRHGPIIVYTRLPTGGTYYPICTFPASSECLIGISDAFSAFCLRVSVIFPTCSLYPKQKRAYSALHFLFFHVALRPRRRDGLLGAGRGQSGKRRQSEGSTAETARKRPERPWTAARTMEVLRRCPLAIAQRLVHCAIAVLTALLDRVTKTMSVAQLLTNNLDSLKQKMSNLLSPAPPPCS